jgi:hypothetical protein
MRILPHLEFKDPIEEDPFGSGMFCSAGHCTGVTSNAPLQVDHHSVFSHYSPSSKIIAKWSISNNQLAF